MKRLRMINKPGNYAKDGARNLKNHGVNINETTAKAAYKIGGGNISMGIRIAVKAQRAVMIKRNKK